MIFFRNAVSLLLFESRTVVAYVVSVISKSGYNVKTYDYAVKTQQFTFNVSVSFGKSLYGPKCLSGVQLKSPVYSTDSSPT